MQPSLSVLPYVKLGVPAGSAASPAPEHIDIEFPEFEQNEVNNLRLLLAESRKQTRRMERALERAYARYTKPGVTDAGYDAHPALDYVAKIISPSVDPEGNDRQEAAEQLLTALTCEDTNRAVACAAMRLVAALIGSANADAWLKKYTPKKKGGLIRLLLGE